MWSHVLFQRVPACWFGIVGECLLLCDCCVLHDYWCMHDFASAYVGACLHVEVNVFVLWFLLFLCLLIC